MKETKFDQPSAGQVNRLLDKFINRPDCVLCYDTTLLDDLPHILVENHRIQTSDDVKRNPDLVQLFRLVDPHDTAGFDTKALPALVKQAGVNVGRFSTIRALEELVPDPDKFNQTLAVQSEGEKAVQAILQMQSSLGQGFETGSKYPAHVLPSRELHHYFRRVCSIPPTQMEAFMNSYFWGILIEAWKYMDWIKPALPTLSIGPRWLTEIFYFRVVHKLDHHIGLDLFSDDPSLVVAGDMHQMPFPAGHFSFIFLKNVIDKSYNVRRLVAELLRVIRDDGIIVTDHDCAYGYTSTLTRTEIQSAENLLRLFQAKANIEALICETPDLPNVPRAARSTKNSRLAIRLLQKRRSENL